MNSQRPLAVTIAVVLHALLGLAAIFITIPEMTGGLSPDEGPPMFIVVISLVGGVLSLVITMFEDDTVFVALQAGARGFILKGVGGEETLRTIRPRPTGNRSSARRWPNG